MKEVGDKFGAGELILPFVLQSAEVMKKAVSHLETYLEKKEGVAKGTLVLATVYGDVHDIGKNLVKTILSNNGYNVIDLGKQVPAETIISKAVEVNADAIGLSALLVSTSKQMPLIVNELHRRGLNFPVMIGGAAINRHFGRRILLTEKDEFYAPGVYYCKDAFEGLETMDSFNEHRTSTWFHFPKPAWKQNWNLAESKTRPSLAKNRGLRSLLYGWPLAYPWHLPGDRAWYGKCRWRLCSSTWQSMSFSAFRGAPRTPTVKHGRSSRLSSAIVWTAMSRQAVQEGWLRPQAVYGYWPCQSEGNHLLIYTPESVTAGKPQELMRFEFPRQPAGDYLCLADYFAPLSSGKIDVVALQVVTVGQEATERIDRLQSAGDYTEAYFAHGLAVQTAEATANYIHQHIRRELGLTPEQGKRYSWGYPSIPDLDDHQKVFQLLPSRKSSWE